MEIIPTIFFTTIALLILAGIAIAIATTAHSSRDDEVNDLKAENRELQDKLQAIRKILDGEGKK